MANYDNILRFLEGHPKNIEAYEDWFELARASADDSAVKDILKRVGRIVGDAKTAMSTRERGHSLMKLCHLYLAPRYFHNYCVYIEWNRPIKKRFYQPRMRQLYPVVRELQNLEDDYLDILGISMPPGVGKTTIALFYMTWIAGKHPEQQILTSSHNAAFLRGCYDEVLRIVDKDGEYLYADVFPNSPMVATNAKDLRIDLQTEKRFQTFQFSSIGAGNAGKVRATRLLYCDDLVDGIETATSLVQLDKLWSQYSTDLRQRKQGDSCKELHIATRWSVHDVIGRLERLYEGDERAKFITIPALDRNGESNFDYPYGLGFSTKMYNEQKDAMNELDWLALYMNEPIERDALLYPSDSLVYYMDKPDEEADAVWAICDSKDKGDDYFSCPILYQYGSNFYLEDVVYDNSLPEVAIPRIAYKLMVNQVKQARFESNSAGGRIAAEVDRLIKEKGGFTKISTKYTTQNKETKILVNSDFVKEHVLFKDKSKQTKEYQTFMRDLCSYTHMGKNRHDDAPDSLAMFAVWIQGAVGNTIELRKRTF